MAMSKPTTPPVAHSDEVRRLAHGLLQEGDDVVGQELVADRTFDVRGVASTALLGHQDPVPLGEGGHLAAEEVDAAEPAVEQDQRLAGAGRLVVHVDAVHVRVRCRACHSSHLPGNLDVEGRWDTASEVSRRGT
jgi:hypothetical protein